MPEENQYPAERTGTRSTISKATLEKLFELFCTHFETLNSPLTQVKVKDGATKSVQKHFYPNENPKEVKITVESEMNKAGHPVEKFVMDNGFTMSQLNFGEWFYKSVNKLKDLPSDARIGVQNDCYKNCYAIYLGYKSLDEFEKKHHLDKYKLPDAAGLNAENELLAQASNSRLTHYIGVYYSIKNYWIKKFILTIDYSKRLEDKFPAFPATQWGFHAQQDDDLHTEGFETPERVNSILFKGSATKMGNHLYINLGFKGDSDITSPMQMNIIGVVDQWGAEDKRIIVSSLQTVSLKGYGVTLEAVLLKTTADIAAQLQTSPGKFFGPEIPGIKNDEQKSLALYLMLQRRNFWVNNRIQLSLTDLQVRSTPVRTYTEQLDGRWRIWNFGTGESGRVVQSCLEIKAPLFASFLFPYIQHGHPQVPMLKKQAAVLTISGGKLCFASYAVGTGSHLRLAQYAIFDLGKLANDGSGYAEGAFISGVGSGTHSLIGGYCVMCRIKEKDFDRHRDGPKVLSRDEAETFAEKLGITKMYEALYLLWENNRERKKTKTGHYAIWLHPEKGFYLVKRERGMYKGRYEFPGGEVKFGESPVEWLKKKFKEQTGRDALIAPIDQDNTYVASTEHTYAYAGEAVDCHSVGILHQAIVTEDIPTTSKGKRAEYVWKKEGDIKQDELTPLAEKIIREELKNYAIYKNVQRSQKEKQKDGDKTIEPGDETFE